MNSGRETGLPRAVLRDLPEDPSPIIERAQRLIFQYPAAAQALFQAFVAEGRRFAETEEGRAWKERLAGSELIRQGRVLWEVSTLNVLESDPNQLLPSKVLDALALAISRGALEPMLSKLFERRMGGNDDTP